MGGLMTVNLEETLTHFVRWIRCTHLTQRNLDFAQATIDNVTAVGMWMEQSPDDDDAPDPGKFTTQAKFKELLENIRQHLLLKDDITRIRNLIPMQALPPQQAPTAGTLTLSKIETP